MVFSKKQTIRSCLPKLKSDRKLDEPGTVYKIACDDCKLDYIGETGRRARVRAVEHRYDIRAYKPTSAPAMHVFGTDHEMSVDDLEILGVEKHYKKRKVREAIEIMRHDTMNLKEQSLQLTPMWRSLLDLRKRRR